MIDEALRFLSLADANVRYVLTGSVLLGAASGVVGTFTVLRKRSLIGDALAHAALPGVALGFLLTLSKSIMPLFIGASVAGILGVLAIIGISKMGRIKEDSAIGIVLSVFFGVGIVLLTHIQRLPSGNQSGLDKFLFGQAASMLPQDIALMSVISLIAVATIILFYKEFRLLVFDTNYLAALGFPVTLLDILLMFLVVLVVMIGLQAVGVVLMAALLITPAAGARFWTDKLKTMLFLAAFFGAVSGVLGAFFSSLAPRIPTGPVMVLAATLFFVISALSAPKRGLLAKWLQQRNNRKRMDQEHFLRATMEWMESNITTAEVKLQNISQKTDRSEIKTRQIARSLAKENMVTMTDQSVKLTEKGYDRALAILKSHRLWEYYLLHRMSLQEDHVHRDADQVEHILSNEMIERLEAILKEQGVDTDKITSVHPVNP
jgi:manganese/zinc/iron transport system permease protein